VKKPLIALAILAATFLPAHADAVVDDVLVRRAGDDVNIRVTVRNPAKARQAGPVMVDLYVRAGESDEWTKVKSWDDIEYIGGGYKVSRDYFDENNSLLKDLAAKGRFQSKAVVTAPGQKDSAEKTSWYDSETNK
jgi:hypothetical protein